MTIADRIGSEICELIDTLGPVYTGQRVRRSGILHYQIRDSLIAVEVHVTKFGLHQTLSEAYGGVETHEGPPQPSQSRWEAMEFEE